MKFTFYSTLLAAVAFTLPAIVNPAFAADSAERIKTPISGLISMGQGQLNPEYNDNAAYGGIPGNLLNDLYLKQNAFDGVVINIPWTEIQPTASTIDVSAIDAVLQKIKAYNANPHTTIPLRAILRIWAGPNAPDWVKNLDGGPVTIYAAELSGHGKALSIARFWTKDYQVA